MNLCPWLVVPHPKNRGGEPVKSLRTKQLTGTLAEEGYDPIEANVNAVVVQDRPAVAEATGFFQSAFAEKLKNDPDIAERGDSMGGMGGMEATAGSLSHGHLNVTFRNVLGGKRGCECSTELAVAGKQCTCPNRPILDEDGNYSLSALQSFDEEWWRGCQLGLEWEVLHWKMDVEEPDASPIICIALNKKNEAAMKTGHLEIMATLVSLCKPDPHGKVMFEPVRDKLIEMYGSAVDHPDFHSAYRLVMSAGGAESVHMKELRDFTTVFVNQKLRKMRMEAYTVVASYPVEFPKIKNASLKWAWRQDTKQGWCKLPPSILHRLDVNSKYEWLGLMRDIEDAMTEVSKIASTVVEEGRRGRTRWIAEVEIQLMSCIFNFSRLDDKDQQEEQIKSATEKCALIIATQLLELVKESTGIRDSATGGMKEYERKDLPRPTDNSDLMKSVCDHLFDIRFPSLQETASKPALNVALTPKVIRMDTNGRPLSQHETVGQQQGKVENIPWDQWAVSETKPDKERFAKLLIELAMANMHAHTWNTIPIVLVRKGMPFRH